MRLSWAARASGRDGCCTARAPSHLAIGLDAVLQTVELPAGISDLDAGLADVDRDHLTHGCFLFCVLAKERSKERQRGLQRTRNTGYDDQRPENEASRAMHAALWGGRNSNAGS